MLTAVTTIPLLAPVAPYPQAAPMPAIGSRLPSLVDDDEKVLLQLAPDGRVTGMRDDLLIQVAGSGDYVLVLPGRVEAVLNQGGDAVPGLQDGHITFMGHLEGRKVLAAEARLDPKRYAPQLPVEIGIGYQQTGKRLDPGEAPLDAALREAQHWLRTLTAKEALAQINSLPRGPERTRQPARADQDFYPYAHPYYWAAFILLGDED